MALQFFVLRSTKDKLRLVKNPRHPLRHRLPTARFPRQGAHRSAACVASWKYEGPKENEAWWRDHLLEIYKGIPLASNSGLETQIQNLTKTTLAKTASLLFAFECKQEYATYKSEKHSDLKGKSEGVHIMKLKRAEKEGKVEVKLFLNAAVGLFDSGIGCVRQNAVTFERSKEYHILNITRGFPILSSSHKKELSDKMDSIKQKPN